MRRRRIVLLLVSLAFLEAGCETLVVLGDEGDASIREDATAGDGATNDAKNQDAKTDDSSIIEDGGSGASDAELCNPFDSGCLASEFCFSSGPCGTSGACTEKPIACADASFLDAGFADGSTVVCDCSGVTRASACFANMAGENVNHVGPCP